jgi:hypothetical protein
MDILVDSALDYTLYSFKELKLINLQSIVTDDEFCLLGYISQLVVNHFIPKKTVTGST